MSRRVQEGSRRVRLELTTPDPMPRIDVRQDWAQRATAVGGIVSVLILGAGLFLTTAATNRQAAATDRQVRLQLEAQAAERFSRAVEQIGSTTTDVRLGGIYSLERLMADNPDDQAAVVQVLSAHVRGHAPATAAAMKRWTLGTMPTTAVQAAATVLARQPQGDHYTAADLRAAELAGAAWHGAILRAAQLQGADVRNADLREADLSGADLERSFLGGAWLAGADLRGADLQWADLSSANLSGANLAGADLRGANLSEVTLDGADLRGANLDGADLSGITTDERTRLPGDA